MPQTLLALCAILAFTYFALGSQRHDHDVERQALGIEVDLAAADVARARMTELERLAFDEESADTGRVRMTPSTAALGPEEGSSMMYDDVDDWDGTTETASVTVGNGSLDFEVKIEVGYVNDVRPSEPSTTPTLTKEVIVTVREQPVGPIDRDTAFAQIRRVVTPASANSVLR